MLQPLGKLFLLLSQQLNQLFSCMAAFELRQLGSICQVWGAGGYVLPAGPHDHASHWCSSLGVSSSVLTNSPCLLCGCMMLRCWSCSLCLSCFKLWVQLISAAWMHDHASHSCCSLCVSTYQRPTADLNLAQKLLCKRLIACIRQPCLSAGCLC